MKFKSQPYIRAYTHVIVELLNPLSYTIELYFWDINLISCELPQTFVLYSISHDPVITPGYSPPARNRS